MMQLKRQRGSSRRKVATFPMSAASAARVNSPKATLWPVTEGASAAAIVAPNVSSISSMAVSALDGAGAADFFLQQHDAVEQRLRRGRTAGHVDINRHDAVAAAHHRIGIM